MSAHDLKDVVVGDEVAVHGRLFRGFSPQKLVVSKATKTQVTLSDGTRWLRRGRRVGASGWAREFAEPWDETERAARAAVDGARLTADQWKRIQAICQESKP